MKQRPLSPQQLSLVIALYRRGPLATRELKRQASTGQFSRTLGAARRAGLLSSAVDSFATRTPGGRREHFLTRHRLTDRGLVLGYMEQQQARMRGEE